MATILPTGLTTFFDTNGDPLVGGKVYFYIPGTTNPKDTYQDATQLVLNTNPILLDAAGRAVIFGSGSYRQIVMDALDNLIWDRETAEASNTVLTNGGTSTGTANAQVLSSGTFDGSDGSTIRFVAGLTNTGPMTLSIGSGSPIPVYINGGSGPEELAAGDISTGNVYQVTYSSTLAAFQLLQSTPPTITIASEADAAAGTNNTNLMTPLRTKQAFNEGYGFVLPSDTQANTPAFGNSSALVATTAFVRQQTKQYDVQHFYDAGSLNVGTSYATISVITILTGGLLALVKLTSAYVVQSGGLPSGSRMRFFNVSENRVVQELIVTTNAVHSETTVAYDYAAAGQTSVNYVVQLQTSSGIIPIIYRGLDAIAYVL